MIRKIGLAGAGLGVGYVYKKEQKYCEASMGSVLCCCGGTAAAVLGGFAAFVNSQESKMHQEGLELLASRASGGDVGAQLCMIGYDLANESKTVHQLIKEAAQDIPECAIMNELMEGTPNIEKKKIEALSQTTIHIISDLMLSRNNVDDTGLYNTSIPPIPPGIVPTRLDDEEAELAQYVGADYAKYFLMDLARRTYCPPPELDSRVAANARLISAVRGFSPFYYRMGRFSVDDGDSEAAANFFCDFIVASATPRQRQDVAETFAYIASKENKSSKWRDIQHLLWAVQIGSAQAEMHHIAAHDGVHAIGMKRASKDYHKDLLTQMIRSSESVGNHLKNHLPKDDPISKTYTSAMRHCKKALNDDLKASENCVEGLRLVTDYLQVIDIP
eukprot:TRINITY_DN12066_c0_g1_i1.p1 TRINITY_DN12066_c0_g1~~TRINITY_DN12066_c0_g1_i1.p1  ORF type:complete len:388 (+),score=53.18 TRINITY_DN12066_c0_g1_i1:39-1202(+)